ncbi:mitochondrial inner membrane protease subunit 2 isoform X4 [Canis lupus baileyi]|uniref:mitochondrial inner membrane protease subunit 2 isoform X4 n=1 Tax=Canis lupus dingo TaxID=286419 RepID=UPI0020C4BC6C|nr:mitochondrial inner membrane protease subunit 2 isoform X4 [Canis lupus dingo]
MAQSQGWVRRYAKAFCKGFFVAVPVAVTFLDRVACVARVEGASMQPSLNPGGSQSSDVVLLNHWKVRNFEVQRGDIVSLVLGPGNVEGISKLQHNCICSKESHRERERQRHRQREKPAPCREPDVGLDPRSPGSGPGLQMALNS